MNYGVLFSPRQKSFRPNKDFLISAGYRLIPDHTFSRLKTTSQYISNADNFKSNFPRFHIIQQGKNWYIHIDHSPFEEQHQTNLKYNKEIKDELARLKLLKQYLSTPSLDIRTANGYNP